MRFHEFSIKTPAEALMSLGTEHAGLTGAAAAERLQTAGFNEIQAATIAWPLILLRQLKSSFIYLLAAAAAISFGLGQFMDGAMILLFVAINTALGFFQEYRSEQTLKLLKRFILEQATVRRDGGLKAVATRELVPGDIVMLSAGDKVPADARVLDAHDLLVDESALSGESAPVEKTAAALTKKATLIFQAANIGFMGTTVVGGQAEALVIDTGRATVMGSVSTLATQTKRESGFEKGLNGFSTFIMRLVLVTMVFIFLAKLVITNGQTDVAGLLIFAIALAVAVIPEALPVVTMFSLSRGALRLARHKVVVRRLSAIEDLGGIGVLCSDKTGTLTENTLSVANVTGTADDAEAAVLLAVIGGQTLQAKAPELGRAGQAFDAALTAKLSPGQQRSLTAYRPVAELPFDPVRRLSSVVVAHGERYRLIVRGAPEAVLKACASISSKERADLQHWVASEGQQGRRVMAVAVKHGHVSASYTPADEVSGLLLKGIISFTDPVKLTAKSAILGARRLGVAIKILTGDSKEVAGAVAVQVGLIESAAEVMTGEELNALALGKQHEAIERTVVFARVSPEQKAAIIEVLKARHVVGFLGEGINDAPALKAANVGIVVAGAADIASEAADIMLLQKSLSVVVNGIKEGREVFANTIKYIRRTLAANFGNFYSVAIAALLIDYLPMLPLQILLVNLLSDLPMLTIAADRVDSKELRKPQGYHIKEITLIALILGVVSSVFDFVLFTLFSKGAPAALQTNWFIFSIVTELVFIYSIRTRLPFYKARAAAPALTLLTLLALAITLALPYLDFSQRLFEFVPPTLASLLIIGGLTVLYFAASEGVKLLYYRHTQPHEVETVVS